MSAPGSFTTLVVAQDFPWPPTIGSHLRLQMVIEAAAALGEVDLFCFVPARRQESVEVPGSVDLARLQVVRRPLPRDNPLRRMRWALSSAKPLELLQGHVPGAGEMLRNWARARYDAVWFSKAATFEAVGGPLLGPTVVDLDDLEDRKILDRLDLARDDRNTAAAKTASSHHVAVSIQARLNAHRWARLQRAVASRAERVVLCSELDARRAQLSNCVVVPNGYRRPAVPLGGRPVGEPPTVLFAGSYRYGPNADAARWLVTRIWPEVCAKRPGSILRLVGEPDNSVALLDDPPSVSLVGKVASMEPELRRADVVAVPLRIGSGTRVKILEAFAHRIPVVSTTLGAEGLEARPGVHLLVADEASAFADACLLLLGDEGLRRSLTERAGELFLRHFESEPVRDRVRRVLLDLAENSGTPGGAGPKEDPTKRLSS